MADIDTNEIKRVLHIILDNAVRYSGDSVNIAVNVRRKGDTKVEVSIADDGVGIPISDIDNVFIPFIESKNTMLETGGKGLGLSVASAILKSHQWGHISAISDNQQGTEIIFGLACLPTNENKTVKHTNKTVLVIDDDDSVRLSHRYGFKRKAHYKLIEADNGYIGMDVFEQYKDEIDIIIIDLMMPSFSGVDVLLEIANKYPKQYEHITPFLCTGASEPDYEYEMDKFGGKDRPTILHKPINTKEIIKVLDNLD